MNIRKFTGLPIRDLDELVDRNMLDAQVATFLRACVRARLSILFAGPPGSGKTTLLSCCAAELDPGLRVVVAEEVFESEIPLPNVAHMQTRPQRSDRPEVDLRRLVAGFLRMAPDVAVVGEVRDREALPLLLTLSSGVTGYTTIHAGSARQALSRLRFLAQLNEAVRSLPLSALNTLVSEAVDLVVQARRTGERVEVTEVLAVEDHQAGPEASAFTVTDLFARARPGQPLAWSGNLPNRATRALEAAGYDTLELSALLRPAHWCAIAAPVSERTRTPEAMGAILALAGACGVYLLYTALAMGWSGLGIGPRPMASGRQSLVRRWTKQVDLEGSRRAETAAVMIVLFTVGAAAAYVIFGGPLPAVAVGISPPPLRWPAIEPGSAKDSARHETRGPG